MPAINTTSAFGETVVRVGPVNIDDAIAHFGDVQPGAEWILDWLKSEGDAVNAGKSVGQLRGLCGTELLVSPVSGFVTEIRAKKGVVRPGAVIAVITAPTSSAGVEILSVDSETLSAMET